MHTNNTKIHTHNKRKGRTERERKEKKGKNWNQRARERQGEEGGRRRRALSPCRRVAVRKGETLSKRKSCLMKERRCASIPPISSRSTVVEGSRRCSRLHLERVVASFNHRRISHYRRS
ncbi:uncharacterized protein DS421_2g37480 [Arachis hypogaea]|nr:uncharacterized protein DS421_2g37480 [Arachis hypogaea]